jgi:hypothetical protein
LLGQSLTILYTNKLTTMYFLRSVLIDKCDYLATRPDNKGYDSEYWNVSHVDSLTIAPCLRLTIMPLACQSCLPAFVCKNPRKRRV